MLAFDASSVIHAWDNYPETQFPKLWKWMSEQIELGEFQIAEVAYKEVSKKIPECATFLKTSQISRIKIGNKVLQEAIRIKGRLGIKNEDYHPEGVGENDILIVAAAKIRGLELVSEESKQLRNPRENRRLKIPAVCQLPDVNVSCLSFIELIKRSEIVF